jgi:hypothetical protein
MNDSFYQLYIRIEQGKILKILIYIVN